ncbi:D-hexose-6-phosphate mutarotase [Pengzhenrongella sp.]|jgi:D-hexose-6-phosphate mutarotase|uniref:D-hexose-6-phosphate mutarotase n=1 Tax=Pengzhenrongella sp. TaxID=2888820 RepID=UPI002F922452
MTLPTTTDLSLPSSVTVDDGPGGLPRVRVAGPAGAAEIYLHGAHVTSWNPLGQEPVLWMSEQSRYRADQPLRGGVPLCFPWFGANAGDPQAPSHGFGRLSDWSLVEAREVGDDVVLVFRLTDSPLTRAGAWPHRFEARYTVTVGARLVLELQVTNLDTEAVTFEEAMHTYFAVGNIHDVRVTGLEGVAFLDRLGGPKPVREDGPVRFTGETDRIYLDTRAPVVVADHARARAVTVTTSGSDSTVVWNPWSAKAAAMADFGDDEWTDMVCVETCNVRDFAVELAPGASHTMTATLAVSPLG